MTDRPYLAASIEELEAAFDRAAEYAELRAISDELQHRKTPRAGKLRWRVGAAMAKTRDPQGQPPSPGLPLFKAKVALAPTAPEPAAPAWLGALLARFELNAPDGRPLHRYRLGAALYEQLTAAIRARAGRLAEGHASDAALLTLWASAWFRREYAGGLRKYGDLGGAIGASLPDAQWRAMIELGLKWWKRPVIRRASGRHRLLTIAVEGGFPVRVLAAGEGWLSRYLNQVVGRLLGLEDDPSADDAFAMAEAARDELRDTYRQAAFVALAADLALAIVNLRRKAQQAAPGLTPSTVLDQIDPKWRDELPIAADSEAAHALIDGMLSAAKIARGLSGGAGCVRVLRRYPEGWRAGLRLSLTGELKAEALAGLAAPGMRLGVHPHGALSRGVREELAFLDPPGEDDKCWRLRPLTRRTEVDGVPLGAKIEVLIQAPNGAARAMAWPGGAPEQSDVVTFEIDGEDELGPKTLVLAANGSASLRAERVVVAAPPDWAARWREDSRNGAPLSFGTTDDGRLLWLADAAVLIEGSDGGLMYCVETGVNEELRDRIRMGGAGPSGFDGADDLPLFAGRPAVQCLRGRATVQPSADELLWRQSRNEPWRELARNPLPFGVVDVMWRDAKTRFVRDRVRAAIIPQAGQVRRERDGGGWSFAFFGFDGFEIVPEQVEGLHVERRAGGAWALAFRNQPRRRVAFKLRAPGTTRAIRIDVAFPLSDGLAHWDGRLIAPGSALTPADLNELVAFAEGRLTLCAELKHADIEVPVHYTLGEHELALRPLGERIHSDLAAAGIDAWMELSFLGSTGAPYRIQPFDSALQCEGGSATVLHAPGLMGEKLQIMGRRIAAPHEEQLLAEPCLEDILNRRATRLQTGLGGAWLIYLRSGRVVRSRPTLVACGPDQPAPGEGLAGAVTIGATPDRRTAIAKRLDALCATDEATGADLAWLHQLISSLDGVPAATFDALTQLPRSPPALALLLMAAPNESVQSAVWRMETQLPFLWTTLPLDAWRRASEALGRITVEPLVTAGYDLAAAAQIARAGVLAAAGRLAGLDPALAASLSASDLVDTPGQIPSLQEAAGGYVRRTYDRGDIAIGVPKRGSLFREGELGPQLPAWFAVRFDPMHLEALDAPVACALAAKGAAVLSPAQLRCCKVAAIEDPIYFAEGFAAALATG